MSKDANLKLLKIEAQRAQTFLFKVPRLADMDGANALLGDLFRQQLPTALEKYLVKAPLNDDAMAKLEALGNTRADKDPIARADTALTSNDDPVAAFRSGILVRDGGRFWGLVAENDIETAKTVAAATIQSHCPGLGYVFHVGDLINENTPENRPTESATDLVALPCFRWSEDGGDEPASGTVDHWLDNERKETRYVSRATLKKRDARKSRASLWDIASLLVTQKAIPAPTNDADKIDFTQIASGRYLAVIHMDGNSIGQRSLDYARAIKSNDFVSRQADMEAFFFGMRSGMRAAVTTALNEHFTDTPNHYRLLMLGGDDVLVVCRADRALPFVCSVAGHLEEHSLADGEPLTIGAGIAIGKPKLPFHRLHELAEQLASSAKRIAVDPEGKRRSVVDWLITTSSWVDSVDEHRSRWDRIRYLYDRKMETLLLTGKPYPARTTTDEIKNDEKPEPSLQALLEFCNATREKFYNNDATDKGIRSQLKHFLGELRKGKTYAELAWAELPENVSKHFIDKAPKGFQKPQSNGEGLWLKLEGSACRCWVADAIELIELQQIGRRNTNETTNETQEPDEKEKAE